MRDATGRSGEWSLGAIIAAEQLHGHARERARADNVLKTARLINQESSDVRDDPLPVSRIRGRRCGSYGNRNCCPRPSLFLPGICNYARRPPLLSAEMNLRFLRARATDSID